jgi:hypothetical protein
VLPCAIALRALAQGDPRLAGVAHPSTWLEPEGWIAALDERGFRFLGETAAAPAPPTRRG